MIKVLMTLLLAAAVLIILGAGIGYLGLINVGADAPQSAALHALLATARQRSIAVRTGDMEVPDLSDTMLIRSGAGNYDALCASCHLAPGVGPTELGENLSPAPPDLTDVNREREPAREFWTIKHGIRATGMPAWGKSLADPDIWGLVALLEQMPVLTPMEYQALVAASGGHQHSGGERLVSSGDLSGNKLHRHDDGTGHRH